MIQLQYTENGKLNKSEHSNFLDSKLLDPLYFEHLSCFYYLRVRVVVVKATFNTISVISWQSVLLGDETRVPGENHRPVASHYQSLLQNVVSSTPCLSGI